MLAAVDVDSWPFLHIKFYKKETFMYPLQAHEDLAANVDSGKEFPAMSTVVRVYF
jgi:hypothetical protein